MPNEKNKSAIKAYYLDSRESRWGYKYLLHGRKHYGFYPSKKRLSIRDASLEMERQLGEMIGLKPGAYLLDAGCGEGLVAIHLAQEFGYRITGIDLLESPSIEEANKNKTKYMRDDVDFRVMDYSSLDFPDNTFDGVYTIETLVHSPDYRKTLKEFYRVLKPGGVLVNFEYVMDDFLPHEVAEVWGFIYKKGSMHTLKDFRVSKMENNWLGIGFKDFSMTDITKNMERFIRLLYRIALVPYLITRLINRHKEHLNTYVGYISYKRPQRKTFHYMAIKAKKP